MKAFRLIILVWISLLTSFVCARAEGVDSVVLGTTPKFIYSLGGTAGINHMMNIELRGEKLGKRTWGANYSLFMTSQANPLDSTISVYDRVFGFPTLEGLGCVYRFPS